MMQKFNLWRSGIILIIWIAWSTPASCLGQDASKLEDALPKEIRNRADVQQIIQRLRFLRMNEANFGENHPKKESTRVQIRESEYELNRIVKLSRASTKSGLVENSINIEDVMPKELRDRPDVQLMIQKLRFMRMNEKYFGENHPNKKSTQEQIRNHEAALLELADLSHQPPIQPPIQPTVGQRTSKAIDLMTPDLQNSRDVRLIVQKLAFLRLNEANFGENHPKWNIIQAEIRELEAALSEMVKLDEQASRNPFLRDRN